MDSLTYKVYRFNIPQFNIKGKHILDTQTQEQILKSKKSIAEEKLDGKQFIINLDNIILICEDLKQTHTIFYKNLPSYSYCFDVYEKDKGYLDYLDKYLFLIENGYVSPRFVRAGPSTVEELVHIVLNGESYFRTEINPKMKNKIKSDSEISRGLRYIKPDSTDFMEGVVVKLYEGGRLYPGKAVNPDFEYLIINLGRYEQYENKNIVEPFTKEEFERYHRNNLNILSEIYKDDKRLSEISRILKDRKTYASYLSNL
ncbi:hypothetical protein MJ1_0252 [Nanobdella aerobiophila]|uniref:RNA ligase domain-containing protein n=1 Tax=Nanobdella aerobiophila TaxID=2586965 RepID=A0A915WRC5_9ARCH|nr:RNA ligase family protein [Nanobdella aerobiophila]BBL45423.1 hypothetical protein MJ1_0252 [Nanobdella aerobiophila]